MKELFTIGEVSKLFGVKVPTLRYYDEIGLLKPEYVEEATKYRYYSTQQFERLNLIKYLRALNMPLERISDFFELREIGAMTELLRMQQEESAAQRERLERIERKIARRLQGIEDALSVPLDTIEEVRLGRRQAVYMRKDYETGDDIEHLVTELRVRYGLEENIFLGKIGISLSAGDIRAGRYDRYAGIFMLLETEDPPFTASMSFAAGPWLRIRFRGTHREAAAYYAQLNIHMQTHGYELIGSSVETTLIDYGLTNDPDKFVTEILLPVTPPPSR
ncbi:MerR family transcriptional regulator [Saccharibacillus alkalitolerans]|uniref:MerR family transcriptional regulator n=1 Tax=Saccharibacillus alkalitolerans TaxID=2705290 RepID=A0ABX0F405_9BACL|nr:MerR family transcriptional regulator [Saccharibacillus alkalitolerans]NGZ73931.1 MerR family transcriptional regulator [Saccharibacillus alkalitolerans]